MKCYSHNERDAVGICKNCSRGLCPDCAVDLVDGLACKGRCEEAVRGMNALVSQNVSARRRIAAEHSMHHENQTPPQWRLSTLFVATTLAAIAVSGYGQLGVNGALGAVVSSWFCLIGLFLVVRGIADRQEGWLLPVLIGLVLTSIAIYGFLTIILADTWPR